MGGFELIETDKLAAALIQRILQNGTALKVQQCPPIRTVNATRLKVRPH
jgi:hypothetical protein